MNQDIVIKKYQIRLLSHLSDQGAMFIRNLTTASIIVASCLLLGGCGLMATQPIPAEVRDQIGQDCECATQVPVSIFATSKEIAEIQARLILLGYSAGQIDGVAGANTQKAIRAYQAEHKLLTDGRPSTELLQHIKESAGNGSDQADEIWSDRR
jgi:hypothetical protein